MRPYRLHYVSDIEGWAYWWAGLGLKANCPQHVTFTMGTHNKGSEQSVREALANQPDIILNMVYHSNHEFWPVLQRLAPEIPLLTVFNIHWGFDGRQFLPTLKHNATHVAVNNRDTFIHAVRAGVLVPERSCFLSYGVDGDIFKSLMPIMQRPKRLKFVSSQGHAKWKGAYILKEMEPALHAAGFETDFEVVDSHGKARRNQNEMNDWYNDGFAYICLSEFEGTPCTALEAASAGSVVITTDVGNMPELIIDRWNGVILKDREPETAIEAVQFAWENRQRLTRNMAESIRQWHWSQRAEAWFRCTDRIIQRSAS